MTGISEEDWKTIKDVVIRFPEVQKAVLFGSRAKGNFKTGSDVDIALFLKGEDITPQLSGVLNDETLLPYKFDVINVKGITNPDLIEHIERAGIAFYEK